ISMDDALAVHIGKGAADLTHDVEPCGGLEYPLFPHQRAEGDAIDILHRDIHPAFALGCKHADDIGMVEATADFLFALETTVKNHRSEEHSLNSSHVAISYAVFCLKKKRKRPTKNCANRKTQKSMPRRTPTDIPHY